MNNNDNDMVATRTVVVKNNQLELVNLWIKDIFLSIFKSSGFNNLIVYNIIIFFDKYTLFLYKIPY
jgi:hypothetical protein